MHHPEGKHGLNSQGNQRHALHPDLARRVPVSLCSNRRHHEMTFRNLWEHDCISIQNQNGLVQTGPTFHLLVVDHAILLGRQVVVLLVFLV
ncbi:hypothetical protein T01_1513 [Trichinella spiralis]|uniref:Uncharacterized protein n=1 Tax=Trichinella spiralis TaxID=6334 RepID=A0A0V1AR01_TRISP|nr:hypothetical protein T01_1513 [Trichinella spiralis]